MCISPDTLDENRKLTIGDRLSYSIAEEKKPAVGLVVMDSGEVDIPLIGRVPAAGRTCRELAASLKAPLEKTYFVKATVVVSLDIATLRSPGPDLRGGSGRPGRGRRTSRRMRFTP